MNRAHWQRLADERLLDAATLLAAGRWTAAYYLAGSAVECGLKSCVLRHLELSGELFADRRYLKDLGECWTHDVPKLVRLAGLTQVLAGASLTNAVFAGSWGIVEQWRETSRYAWRTEAEARTLVEAMTQDPDGVLPWIRLHW